MDIVACERPIATVHPVPAAASPSVSNPPRDSAALRRLMEEVRCEETTVSASAGYNRQHNRHNR